MRVAMAQWDDRSNFCRRKRERIQPIRVSESDQIRNLGLVDTQPTMRCAVGVIDEIKSEILQHCAVGWCLSDSQSESEDLVTPTPVLTAGMPKMTECQSRGFESNGRSVDGNGDSFCSMVPESVLDGDNRW
ncbi:hypothetical protein V6N12_013293 [Hibiscus sabdariffa]|uniref:Uncharacterized protein n=1 Tax=Hibiscus sabdariffa TaxID=183260 RepID=A0ABR2D633_9ROSI